MIDLFRGKLCCNSILMSGFLFKQNINFQDICPEHQAWIKALIRKCTIHLVKLGMYSSQFPQWLMKENPMICVIPYHTGEMIHSQQGHFYHVEIYNIQFCLRLCHLRATRNTFLTKP